MDDNQNLQVPQRVAGVHIPQSNTGLQVPTVGGLQVPTAGGLQVPTIGGLQVPSGGTGGLRVPDAGGKATGGLQVQLVGL